MTPDPYAPHLRQADELFAQEEFIKAGQIWQAILKQQPTHAEARERLMAVRQRLLALREAQQEAPIIPEPAAASPVPPRVEPPAPMAPPSVNLAPIPSPLPVSPPVPTPAPLEAAHPGFQAPPSPPEPEPPSVMAALAYAPPPVPAPVLVPSPVDSGRLVIEGCTLYDMGQVGDALKKWELALDTDPGHVLARSYAGGARRELGLPPLASPELPAPSLDAPAPFGDDDVARLLREAVQLYDMGLAEEAITKWERILILEPHREEISEYLRQARQEVTQSALQPSVPTPPAPRGTPDDEALDLKLRQAGHLLTLQRHEEAAFTYQQALVMSPGHPQALAGLERCRRPAGHTLVPDPGAMALPVRTSEPMGSFGRISMVEEEPSPVAVDPGGVEPPASLLKATSAPREGLSLPGLLRGVPERLPWLKNPKVLVALGGAILALSLGFAALHSYRKDQELKEAVKAAKAAAVAPVIRQAQAPDLAEGAADIREEAEATLEKDPLRAFLRAQTLVTQHPGDAGGPQLLEKARAGLPGGVSGASLSEFQKHRQNGDLEAAAKVMDALLRAQPDDGDLRARAAHLHLLLCSAHAGQAKWDEAAEDLRRGRALAPGDKTWQTRLKLLERVKTLPKAQQAAWIPLLG